MAPPIGERHEPAAEKRRPSRKEPDHHQRAADQFDRTCDRNDERWNLRWRRRGNAQQFLRPVPEKEKTSHHSHERIRLSGIGAHERGHRILLWKRWNADEARCGCSLRKATEFCSTLSMQCPATVPENPPRHAP